MVYYLLWNGNELYICVIPCFLFIVKYLNIILACQNNNLEVQDLKFRNITYSVQNGSFRAKWKFPCKMEVSANYHLSSNCCNTQYPNLNFFRKNSGWEIGNTPSAVYITFTVGLTFKVQQYFTLWETDSRSAMS